MAPAAEKAAEANELGRQAFKEKRFDDAVRHFGEAIGLSPKDHILYSSRSAAYAKLSRYEEALGDADMCVTLKPEWAKGYHRRGAAQLQLKRYDEAEASYRKGLELAPQDAGLREGMELVSATQKKTLYKNKDALVKALDYLREAKAQAVEKEQYEEAQKWHRKIKEIEEQLMKVEKGMVGKRPSPGVDEDDMVGGYEAPQDDAGASSSPAKSLGTRFYRMVCPERFFDSANPFETWRKLRSVGYGGKQTCGILALIYVISLASPLVLLAMGSRVLALAQVSLHDGDEA